MKSPLSLLFSKMNKPCDLHHSLSVFFSWLFIISVALLWIHSNSVMSFLDYYIVIITLFLEEVWSRYLLKTNPRRDFMLKHCEIWTFCQLTWYETNEWTSWLQLNYYPAHCIVSLEALNNILHNNLFHYSIRSRRKNNVWPCLSGEGTEEIMVCTTFAFWMTEVWHCSELYKFLFSWNRMSLIYI